jgi:hypothetical protein
MYLSIKGYRDAIQNISAQSAEIKDSKHIIVSEDLIQIDIKY